MYQSPELAAVLAPSSMMQRKSRVIRKREKNYILSLYLCRWWLNLTSTQGRHRGVLLCSLRKLICHHRTFIVRTNKSRFLRLASICLYQHRRKSCIYFLLQRRATIILIGTRSLTLYRSLLATSCSLWSKGRGVENRSCRIHRFITCRPMLSNHQRSEFSTAPSLSSHRIDRSMLPR